MVSESEFKLLTFDGWCTVRNESVLGMMKYLLREDLLLHTFCVGNFKINLGHSADDVAKYIVYTMLDRMNAQVSDYFVSDSAPMNKAAVRLCMENEGDNYLFPFSVHFAQLAMRDAPKLYFADHLN